MDLTTFPTLVQLWYKWAVFVGVALVSFVTVWIFVSAILRERHSTLWQFLSVVLLVLTLPGLVFWAVPNLSQGDLEKAVIPTAYVGLGATAFALLIWVLFLAGVAVTSADESQVHPYQAAPYESPAYPPPFTDETPTQQATASAAWQETTVQPAQPSPVVPPAPPAPTPTMQVGSSSPSSYPSPPQASSAKTEVLRREPTRMAWLVVTVGMGNGRDFRLGEVTSIGRTGENDIVLDDTGISRQHAKIRLRDDQFVLHDLATTNGTFVRNRETKEWEQIDRHVLQEGDQVKIGRIELTFMEIQPGSGNEQEIADDE